MEKVNISEKFSQFHDHWHPRIVAELNGQHVKLAKVKGEFTWHKHDEEDEMFVVMKGQLTIEFRDRTISMGPGEMLVVPKGVEHKPVAENEAEIMLFEPASTVNTGDENNELTKKDLDWI